MRSLVFGSALAGASLSLYGCGGGDDATTTPAPAPKGTTVQLVWDNHFGAFGGFNVPQIMEDYDDDSIIKIWNDKCFVADDGAKRNGLKLHKGKAAIQKFFEDLFKQLDNKLDNVNTIGPVITKAGENGNPVVKEITGDKVADGNVFLTWRTGNLGAKAIDLATDTFSFKKAGDRYMIDLQTIVVSEPNGACASGGDKPDDPPADNPLFKGWDNHFKAFGAKNVADIMKDYDENSIVQVYDNRDTIARTEAYAEFKGIAPITQMFTDLFKEIGDAGDNVAVGLLEIDTSTNSVFLGWRSNSHPKATDTFIFDGDKIRRQTIVVTTKEPTTTAAGTTAAGTTAAGTTAAATTPAPAPSGEAAFV